MQLQYLLDGKVKLEDWYIDSTQESKKSHTPDQFEDFRKRVKNRETHYYGETDKWLYEALDLIDIKGVNVGIMGSTEPWYETIVLEYGGKPTTIEYNLPNYGRPDIEEISVADFQKNPRQFDIVLSISSFEHDGLGRYGDPLNPTGDLIAMANMKTVVKRDGILILAVPVGLDKVVWNAHRIYGNVRYPMLTERWSVEGYVGLEAENFNRDTGNSGAYQPIAVLRNR